jgi:glycosyltransferase involved in cell wall biosynthesis
MSTAPARPRVSIVIAAFNAEPFIDSTIASALGQTFRDFEILVVDDGSHDGTAAVVRRRVAMDTRVRLLVQPNSGPSAARNRGVADARGELIAFLDHDDLWHPDKLALQVSICDARPEVGVVSCYSAVIDRSYRCLGWRLGGDADGDVYEDMLEWDMISGGSVALIRRGLFQAVGGFDETLRFREDWDLWIRLARRTPFATVRRTLVGYTRSDGGDSRHYAHMAADGALVLEKVGREDARIDDARLRFCRARDLFAMACFCTIDGQVALAWRFLGRSLRCTPMPVLRSAKRWALVGVLALQTLAPLPVFRRLFGSLSRAGFRLRVGQPFSELA